jgi:hypothetical protein
MHNGWNIHFLFSDLNENSLSWNEEVDVLMWERLLVWTQCIMHLSRPPHPVLPHPSPPRPVLSCPCPPPCPPSAGPPPPVLAPLLAPQGTGNDWREGRMDGRTDGRMIRQIDCRKRVVHFSGGINSYFFVCLKFLPWIRSRISQKHLESLRICVLDIFFVEQFEGRTEIYGEHLDLIEYFTETFGIT